MTPLLLSHAGYTAKPTEDPTTGSTRVAFPAIPLLAVLHQEGQATLLDKITADDKQNNATRLTCIMALHFAGENIDLKVVTAIYEKDPRLECRVLALLALGLSEKNAAAVPKLVEALDDKNREIRLAAIHSLRTFAPKAALPKLLKVIQAGEPSELVKPGIDLLGAIGGDEAAGALAEYMQKLLKNGGKQNYDVYYALRAFSTASNSNWIEAGAHSPEYYADKAEKAIDWWKTREKLKK
jgi:HEAT repeat protein